MGKVRACIKLNEQYSSSDPLISCEILRAVFGFLLQRRGRSRFVVEHSGSGYRCSVVSVEKRGKWRIRGSQQWAISIKSAPPEEKRQQGVQKAAKDRANWEDETYNSLMNRITQADMQPAVLGCC